MTAKDSISAARTLSLRRRLLGIASIGAALAANPWTFYWALGRQIPFSGETIQNILLFQGVLLATGLLCLLPHHSSALWHRLGADKLARWLATPARNRHFWLSLLPFFLASIVRQSPLWEQTPYLWKQALLLSMIIENALGSALLKTGIIAVLVAFSRRPWLTWLLALALALMDFMDWAFINFGSIRLTLPSVLHATEGIHAYQNTQSSLAFLVFLGTAIFAAFTLQKLQGSHRPIFARRRLIWAVLILLLSPTRTLHRVVTAPLPAVERAISAEYLREVEPMSIPPLVNLTSALFQSGTTRTTAAYTADEARLLEGYKANGAPPAPLPGRPFHRIILVTLESFSLNLLSRYNPALGGTLTPHLDRLAPSATNLRSVAMPTQFGLAAHLCSHPLAEGVVELGHPNALPAYLAKRGWLTAFYQSAPLAFQRGDKRFREQGYQIRFGREEATQQPALRPHIGEWGLRDRLVYEEAVKCLDQHRDRPVFLHVLTADTHGPSGRINYGSLAYPPTPAWIANYPTAGIYLQSWFRADHDFGLFLEQLKARRLLDEDTALIITGDHNCPTNPISRGIPEIDSELVDRIPWILFSPRALPPLATDRLSSQVDTAPTVAHLAGLPPLPGWWGQSLLAAGRPLNQIAQRGQAFYVVTTNQVTEQAPSDLKHAALKIEVR